MLNAHYQPICWCVYELIFKANSSILNVLFLVACLYLSKYLFICECSFVHTYVYLTEPTHIRVCVCLSFRLSYFFLLFTRIYFYLNCCLWWLLGLRYAMCDRFTGNVKKPLKTNFSTVAFPGLLRFVFIFVLQMSYNFIICYRFLLKYAADKDQYLKMFILSVC